MALAVTVFRQQNEFIDILLGAQDKTSDLLGKGELIVHFYLQYQTYSDDAAAALDGDATINASGDNVFTDIDDDDEEEEEEVIVQGLAVTWCV